MRTAFYTVSLVCVVGAMLSGALLLYAAQSYTTVASTVEIVGSPRDGDIISYDPATNTYHPSRTYADEMVYGVVVLDPVLHLSDVNTSDTATTGMPVVRYGEVIVNVSTVGGEIRAGDLVTTSDIEGLGQRVAREDGSYVLGFALEGMRRTGETIQAGKQTLELGQVAVALRIGPYVTKQGAELIASTTLGFGGDIQYEYEKGINIFKVFRYLLATFVATLAILVAARRFGDTFSQSVISVGRNPLARSQIRSMVIWNSFLIILISCVGFGISALIIFIP